MPFSIRNWASSLVIALGLAANAAHSQIPPADFFKPPLLRSAQLSPSGAHLAAIRYVDSIQRDALVIINLEGPRTAKVIAAHADNDVASFQWVGESRLVYDLTDRKASYLHQRGSGLFSVSRDGEGGSKKIIDNRWSEYEGQDMTHQSVRARPRNTVLDPTHQFHSVVRDGGETVLVVKGNWRGEELTSTILMRVNVITGRSEVVSTGAPENAQQWLMDASGTPRVTTAVTDGQSITYYRPTAQAPWTVLLSEPAFGLQASTLSVVGLRGDNELFVTVSGGSAAGESVLATWQADQPKQTPRVLVSTPGFDFQGRVVSGPGNTIVGVHTLTDAWGSSWFTPEMKAAQAAVDKALPATVNMLDCGACDKPQRVLVQAYSDRQPSVFYLYDMASQKLEPVSATRPWIKPTEMAQRGFERIQARDGLGFPVHITRPLNSKGPAPMVVLVHGGPWVRGGEWEWDAQAQFLASRGYVVIEPEFRGSTGYGFKLFSASFKQWGLAMQDDVADATRWAIAKGYADPKRICIAGGSYGGYAAMMGLVRDPDLYRCAVNIVGVTDLNLLYTSGWSDTGDTYKKYGMPLMVGDRVKDAAQLAATSPVQQARKITQPVLMLYGRQDRRVPIAHGDAMHAALKEHNPNVTYKVYNDEGHGFALAANNIDAWTRIEAFLNRYIGPGSAQK